jgi:hypothetical protein
LEEMETPQKRRKCIICDRNNGDIVEQIILAGEGKSAAAQRVNSTFQTIARHLRRCVEPRDPMKFATLQAAVRKPKARKPESKSSRYGVFARKEALGLYKLTLVCPGQTASRVRMGIQVSESDREHLLRVMLPAEVEGVVEYRNTVLAEFDKIIASPPPGLAGRLARARHAYHQKYTSREFPRRADVLRG